MDCSLVLRFLFCASSNHILVLLPFLFPVHSPDRLSFDAEGNIVLWLGGGNRDNYNDVVVYVA
jgi:hypothetical protein